MKRRSLSVVFLLMFFVLHAHSPGKMTQKNNQDKKVSGYKVGKLLYKDDFNNGLKDWVVEVAKSPTSTVVVKNSKLVIDVDGGATIWLNKKFSGNLMITFKRKVIVDSGPNDRLSDLNQFWMASDPKHENLFTRSGVFSEYDSLLMYYVGFGGNSNTTTRFRKYTGNGERVLYSDLTDKIYLLKPNKVYSIKIVVYDSVSKFFVDDKQFFSFRDTKPISQGYFGFRTTQSRQEIDDFKVYQLDARL